MWFRSKRIENKDWEVMNNDVVTLTNGRRMEEALLAGKELYEVSKNSFGKQHKHTVTALNNLGIIYTLREEFAEAESYLLAALQISERASGEISREVALVNMNLANLYGYKAKKIMALIEK